jgi:hypothetical protein
MTGVVDRVASRAQTVTVGRVLLTVLAAPVYVLGAVAGVLVAVVLWAWAAGAVGFSDAKGQLWRS